MIVLAKQKLLELLKDKLGADWASASVARPHGSALLLSHQARNAPRPWEKVAAVLRDPSYEAWIERHLHTYCSPLLARAEIVRAATAAGRRQPE